MLKPVRFLFAVVITVLVHGAGAFAAENQALVLTKLLIADTEAGALAMKRDTGADARVVVQDVPLLAGSDFPPVVLPYFGQPLSLESVNQLAGAMKQYAIKRDRVINIVVPDQPRDDIARGVLRLAVVVNRYSTLDVKGNRWFSSKLLREKLGVHPGDEISISRLDEAVNWANANPFRRVQVLLRPLEGKPGSTDLIIGVQERIPLRLVASYDDTGNAILGKRHYTGSIQYGNFLGLDHQLSYQFGTSDHQGVFKAHSLNYQAPLPWHHRLDFSASYFLVDATLLGGAFHQNGKNAGADLRYTIPLRGGDSPFEVFGGINYKQNHSDVVYGSLNFVSATDILELETGLSAIHRDKMGAWAVGLTLNLSPGNFNARNSDAAFQGTRRPFAVGNINLTGDSYFDTGRIGARAQYVYGSFSFQRAQNLGHGWQFLSRGIVQASTANLMGSEQISIGGSSTVRGFDERILSADTGFVVSNDLQTPALRHQLNFLSKKLPPLESRFSIFYDAGQLRYLHPSTSDIPQHPLASAGLGARLNLGTYFNLTADYGWQITRLPPHYSSSRNRGHVKLVLAY